MFDEISHQPMRDTGLESQPASRAWTLVAQLRGEPGRAAAENFVRAKFFRTHQACIRSFMPVLLGLTDHTGILHGVVGSRFAESEPLFLERYLDSPVEQTLGHHVGARIPRSSIVEVGNLACRDSRTARRLISMLPRHLMALGRTWIAFTATSSVRRILSHAGARPLELAKADPGRIADTADTWGHYYEHDPHVLAGYLPSARKLPALWGARHEE